ncbi:4'-phosphopantetheinyl transferase [Dysgonomonadaceae bacterium PH5-43]|nr:4'-phosphopantetheinyl transferase [Dysgonomonadaceae bacterium PH5-43]
MNTLENIDDCIVGVLPIEHSSDELIDILRNNAYLADIETKCEARRVEKLTVRYLIYMLLGEHKKITYNENGRPLLHDNSYNISISHTKGYVAVALSKKHEVGIDIEFISTRVKNIQSRFMSDVELKNISTSNPVTHLLLHWSAKESLFKRLNYKDINFISELEIQPFVPKINQWAKFMARETRSKKQQSFAVDYLVTDDYVLTIVK